MVIASYLRATPSAVGGTDDAAHLFVLLPLLPARVPAPDDNAGALVAGLPALPPGVGDRAR